MDKKINKEIITLAIPNIISNISVPFLSTVDTILMGGLSSLHLAAVGLGSMLFNIIYWNFGFLRMGTTGITAQFFGAEDRENVWIAFLKGAILALILSAVILLFRWFLYDQIGWALNVGNDLNDFVYEYFKIRILAAPASLLLMVIMGWFFGVQNAIYPLILTILINVANIALSYYLVVVQGMEIKGVALGTVFAQYLGVLAGLLLMVWKYRAWMIVSSWSLLTEIASYVRFMKVNIDLFIRTVCLTFVFGFFYSQSSVLGNTILAVNVVLMQFINWMSYGIDGFAYASESLVGKYKGARNNDSLMKVINYSFFWGGVVSLLYAAIYLIMGDRLFLIFSDDPSLITMADNLLYVMAFFPLLAFASYIWDGIFVGLTATVSMRNAMVASLAVFLLCYYLLPTFADGSQIWIALSIFMVARALFQWLYFKKYGLAMS